MWEWGEVKAWVVMARKARIMCCFIMVFVMMMMVCCDLYRYVVIISI